MNKIIKCLIIFMLSIFILVPSVAAWNLQTHQTIASKVYYSLPSSVQKKLDLKTMKKGSIYPDVSHTDYYTNVYPNSVTVAQNWLNKGKAAYKSKNYKYASYCFGVASHYITDTFSGPHCTVAETHAQHVAYEKQATNMKPSITYKSGTLTSLLLSGYNQGKKDWASWLKTKKSSIVQKDLNSAGSAAYSQIKKCV